MTVTKVRKKLVDEFSEHIISVDQNVTDEYEQENSFHAVILPDTNGDSPCVPEGIEHFFNNKSSDYSCVWCGKHYHVVVECQIEDENRYKIQD
jgi:hypothetical protein